MKTLAFRASYAITWQTLQLGAALARLHNRSSIGTQFVVWLAWLPVRGVGLALFQLTEALA